MRTLLAILGFVAIIGPFILPGLGILLANALS